MLCYFFRSVDFGFSAPRFFRGNFREKFVNTGTSFLELRVWITALFFPRFSHICFGCFLNFSFIERFFKSSIVTIFMTRLHWNFQKVFFKLRRKNGSLKVFSKFKFVAYFFPRKCPKPGYRYSAICYWIYVNKYIYIYINKFALKAFFARVN